ncbi:acetyltransferase [Undibacterium sp. YM2]|nr:acetyltransferase [Undibacterium sp. YM2]
MTSAMSAEINNSVAAYDVFNGDADGICALHQLRLAEPLTAELITGAKRDIDLLNRFSTKSGDRVTVVDISLDSNISALRQHLNAGAKITYFDHHNAAQAFEHEHLDLHCDLAADVCSSILVNRYLNGLYWKWAVVAAYGDNLPAVATVMAGDAGLSQSQREHLQELGTLLNYNAYGESVDDLHFHPAALYQAVHDYIDPFDFLHNAAQFTLLRNAYASDMAFMQGLHADRESELTSIYILPAQAWARRVSGILANQLTQEEPGKSFAVLTAKPDGNYVVSIRSGDADRCPAGQFCSAFATGGGRRGAGGINHLQASEVDSFVQAFIAYFEKMEIPQLSLT